MLFYDSIGPNPRVVRMFMAERGIELPRATSTCAAARTASRPTWQESGRPDALPGARRWLVLAEITAICEYLDEHPGPR